MKQLLFLLLITSHFLIFAQADSTFKKGYSTANSISREIGSNYEVENTICIESLHGYKFSKEFGIFGGFGFIFYENLKLMPLLVSIRKTPTKERRLGFNFDIGYAIPLSGSARNEFIVDYKLLKGGTYFNPAFSTLLYEGPFFAYLTIGYRVYSYTESYRENFRPQALIEDEVIDRLLSIGVTVEF